MSKKRKTSEKADTGNASICGVGGSALPKKVSSNPKKPTVTDLCPRCLGSGIDPDYGFGIYSACPECQ